jgi:hypothetical protein
LIIADAAIPHPGEDGQDRGETVALGDGLISRKAPASSGTVSSAAGKAGHHARSGS